MMMAGFDEKVCVFFFPRINLLWHPTAAEGNARLHSDNLICVPRSHAISSQVVEHQVRHLDSERERCIAGPWYQVAKEPDMELPINSRRLRI